jgi:hypothetical protein
MNLERDCFISIANAKAGGTEFSEWLKTEMGQIGLELADHDVSSLHVIYANCEPIRLH